MQKKGVIGIVLSALVFLVSCSSIPAVSLQSMDVENKTINPNAAYISSVNTDLVKRDNWHIVEPDAKSITIEVDAENTSTVLFWVVPTGTEVGAQKTLIGIDLDGSDGWSCTWMFGDRSIHDHIVVQALAEDSVTMSEAVINVTHEQ